MIQQVDNQFPFYETGKTDDGQKFADLRSDAVSGSQDPLVVDERAAAELSRPRGHGPDHGGQPGPLVRIGVLAPDDLGLEAFRVDPAGWKLERENRCGTSFGTAFDEDADSARSKRACFFQGKGGIMRRLFSLYFCSDSLRD